MKKSLSFLLAPAFLMLSSCHEIIEEILDGHDDKDSGIEFKNHSVEPSLLKKMPGFKDVEVYTLMSSTDNLPMSPEYTLGGSVDGAGLLKSDDGYVLLVNNEDNYAVSRIHLNEEFEPVKGSYILNSSGAGTRMCSASLATPEEHGFGPIFLTAGESGPESQTHGVSPYAEEAAASIPQVLPALGRWNAENALPLPLDVTKGKTMIIIGDDDSGPQGGQVAMYMSDNQGDLNNGKVYVLRRVDQDPIEKNMSINQSYEVEFVEIENAATNTGEQNNLASEALNSIAFGRVEDLDYGKGSPSNKHNVYFEVTGQLSDDGSRSKWGRTYKLRLDPANPLKGTLEVLLDGDDPYSDAFRYYMNPDNIMVTENYIYIQEDPNGYTRAGEDEGRETHDAYLYQYNLKNKKLKPVFETNLFRDNAELSEYFSTEDAAYGAWEYGAMLDVTDVLGETEPTFVLCIQPHTWRRDEFKGVDGGSIRPNENQGSQIVVIRGLDR
ncbi:hypothetical protein PZB74_03000 [Porifericola rhodea]|uniref:hypothetical protein n=1 Tax=Porifericola rhodea TaxID=930972 RepID=UPI0026655EAA|nr:hypothetical protein [Porifericola rhodea]WKN32319.1 hypothetical protein PZB74_03000 [Porifericola rhodea]